MPHQQLRTEFELISARAKVEKMVHSIIGESAHGKTLFWLSDIRKDDRNLTRFALKNSGYDFDAREELLRLKPFAGDAPQLNDEFDLWLRWIAWSCRLDGAGIIFSRRDSIVYDFLELFGTFQPVVVPTREFTLKARHGKKELPGSHLYLDPPGHRTIRSWIRKETDTHTLSEFLDHLRGQRPNPKAVRSKERNSEQLRNLISEELKIINMDWFGVGARKTLPAASGTHSQSAEASTPVHGRLNARKRGTVKASSKHSGASRRRDRIFISYSHEDKKWLERLKKHLAPIVRNTPTTVWDDTRIKKGAKWVDEINKALASVKVAVLLVSPAFFSSDFIAQQELPLLLKAAQRGDVRLLWVPVKPSSVKETDIWQYQAAHDPSNPLSHQRGAPLDDALVDVCKEIKVALES